MQLLNWKKNVGIWSQQSVIFGICNAAHKISCNLWVQPFWICPYFPVDPSLSFSLSVSVRSGLRSACLYWHQWLIPRCRSTKNFKHVEAIQCVCTTSASSWKTICYQGNRWCCPHLKQKLITSIPSMKTELMDQAEVWRNSRKNDVSVPTCIELKSFLPVMDFTQRSC